MDSGEGATTETNADAGTSADARQGMSPGLDASAEKGSLGDSGADGMHPTEPADGAPPDSLSEAAADAPCGASDGPRSTGESSGWTGDWVAGDYPPGDITAQNYLTISNVPGQQGHDRQYKVHVPPGYDKAHPAPLLFCIHGLAQNAPMFCTDTGVAWNTKSDQEGFVLVMPNGYMNSWNAGTCCGQAVTDKLDDVALIRAIFTEVGKHVNVDLGRVYSTGLSNGAYLSYRLACEASDIFVAVAPNAGAIGTAAIGGGTTTMSDIAACTPTHKVSVLDIHGTSDPLIPYSTQAPTLAIMASNNGCSMTTTPATIPPSGGDTTCVTYQGCACSNVEVTACSIQGGGHCWFGSRTAGPAAGPSAWPSSATTATS